MFFCCQSLSQHVVEIPLLLTEISTYLFPLVVMFLFLPKLLFLTAAKFAFLCFDHDLYCHYPRQVSLIGFLPVVMVLYKF